MTSSRICQLSGILLVLVDQKTLSAIQKLTGHPLTILLRLLCLIFVSASKQFQLNSLSVVFKVESCNTVFHGRHIYISVNENNTRRSVYLNIN